MFFANIFIRVKEGVKCHIYCRIKNVSIYMEFKNCILNAPIAYEGLGGGGWEAGCLASFNGELIKIMNMVLKTTK